MIFRRTLPPILILSTLLLSSERLAAEDSAIEMRGSVRSYFVAVDTEHLDAASNDRGSAEYYLQNRARFKFLWIPSANLQGEFAYDIRPVLPETARNSSSSSSTLFASIEGATYRAKDLNTDMYSAEEDLIINQNLDRAFITISPDFGDINIGRQPVAFGSAMVVNPTDILAPFAFNALDVEDRPGVDAVRIILPVGVLSELDLGLVFGDDFEEGRNAAFARSKLYVANTDLTLMVLSYRGNVLMGLDISRSIGGAGFWLEAANTFAGVLEDRRDDEDFFRASTGIDYHFNVLGGITAFIEYHYNGASEGETGLYSEQTSSIAYQESGVYLLGQHYISPGFSWMVKPLLIFDASLLWNIDDSSAYLSTRLEYDLGDDLYVGVGADFALGDSPGSADLITSETPSEFGMYPDLYFSYIRLYF